MMPGREPREGEYRMRIDTDDYRVGEGKKVDLAKWPTDVKRLYKSKDHYRELLATHVAELSALQEIHYAANRHAVLFILQAMDTAGKDGVIRHVMSGINPQGCQVVSFKHPSGEELQHDFLWRASRALPERGKIGIFNRSYYEEVLILRVHPELLQGEGLDLPADGLIWPERYRSIVDFEKHLHENGTRVVKFFLHISPEEQRKRLLSRLDDPDKTWKFNADDIAEREYWHEYMEAYGACLQATSTRDSPWYAVPSDDKENTRLIVMQVLLETFRALHQTYPIITPQKVKELRAIRRRLAKKSAV
jgi:PPK2 family polyphosphate:nucleotide phosphotransferase